MTRLEQILAGLDAPVTSGNMSIPISGIAYDSRQIQPGWLFVAIRGEKSDGHKFVDDAIKNGAVAVIAETSPEKEHKGFPWIRVADTRKALGRASAVFFKKPTSKLVLVGITGTNGKTTLTYLLESILKAAGCSPGVIGTVSYRWDSIEQAAKHTTPEASDLQDLFSQMVDSGVTHAIIEVSSHGLHRGRLESCEFDIGVFTNLTQDHLDYHGNMEEYYLAKRILFSELLPQSPKRSMAVINQDDSFGKRLASEINLPITTYGTSSDNTIFPERVDLTFRGISGTIRTPGRALNIRSTLTGSFNLSNILAAVAVAESLGLSSESICQGIEKLESVPGRLERIASKKGLVFVDYAHTPNALKNVLEAIRTVHKGRIITIMGCGGDRDKSKRPLMGMEAAAGSDFVIVTSDNPRTEDPLSIIREVENGVIEYGFSAFPEALNGKPLMPKSYKIIPDRRQAIQWAVAHIQDNDVLLIAGKGHETYQEINGVRYQFDDREVVREALAKIGAYYG